MLPLGISQSSYSEMQLILVFNIYMQVFHTMRIYHISITLGLTGI
jgi:hypothetical protein